MSIPTFKKNPEVIHLSEKASIYPSAGLVLEGLAVTLASSSSFLFPPTKDAKKNFSKNLDFIPILDLVL
jgi:hypothetical protein